MFVCLFIYSLFFCFNHHRIPKGSFPQNFVKIQLDLAEILSISKLDWRDGGGGEEEGEKGRRRGGILLCNGLILVVHNTVCHYWPLLASPLWPGTGQYRQMKIRPI